MSTTRNIVLGISFGTFIPGVIGLILNVFIFTRPILRREPCSIYFFSATCCDLFVVLVVMPVRILSNGFRIDPANLNGIICKIETFTFYMFRATSCWLIALACIDRFIHSSSNVRIRRFSSIKIARFVVIITSTIIAIYYSHMLVYFNLISMTNQYGIITFLCTVENDNYLTILGFLHMAFYALCPSFLMILFGSLTINNIRKRQRQILPINIENNGTHRRTSSQLLRMLAAQVFIIIVSTLPFSIMRIYGILTANISKSTYQYTTESYVSAVVITIPYFAHTSSFYLYTLTGAVFRKEFFKLKIIHCLLIHSRNNLHNTHIRTN